MKKKPHIERPKIVRYRCLLVIAFSTLWCVSPLLAQTTQPSAEEPPPEVSNSTYRTFGGPDSVPKRIASDSRERGTLWNFDALKPYYEWKAQLLKDYGYSFGFAYIPILVTASSSLPETKDWASSAVLRHYGSWELTGRGTDTTGTLNYLVEHRQRYTRNTPAAFSMESLGNVGAIGIPYADDGWHLTNFYWSQSFLGGRFDVVAGFLDITDFVDVYAQTSPWTDFFNYAFSIGIGTMDLPDDASLGMGAGAWVTDNIYAIAGFEDLNSDPNRPNEGFRTAFGDHEFIKHVEIGWAASKELYYVDNVHLVFWHADERDDIGIDSGWGLVLSAAHTIGDHWQLFARAGLSEGGGSIFQKSVSLGGGYQFDPRGDAPGDILGVGVNWGQPNDDVFGTGLDDQYTFEMYYRLQITKELAITPDVQCLVHPALNPGKDVVWVFGLRARLAF